MNNRRMSLGIIMLSLIIWGFSCGPMEKEAPEPRVTIALINPSSWSLNSFLYLVSDYIVDISGTCWWVIYDETSQDRYEGGQALRQRYSDLNIKLEMVKGRLTMENLFRSNEFSDDFEHIFSGSDGMLFFGGADIPPNVYGEKTSLLTGIDTPHRHLFELSLLFHLLGGYQDESFVPLLNGRPDYVVYGFCLGMQTMNVATGGSLIQDIPSEVYEQNYIEDVLQLDPGQLHQNYWNSLYADDNLSGYQFHRISLLPDRFFTINLNTDSSLNPLVYSYHHQAVDDLGKGFVPAAISMDGRIVEAMQHSLYPNVLGVQFHPENYLLYQIDGKNYKWTPQDSTSGSPYEILKMNNSLTFHLDYWRYFSDLF